jgi:hypothetical protein
MLVPVLFAAWVIRRPRIRRHAPVPLDRGHWYCWPVHVRGSFQHRHKVRAL